MLPSSHDLSYFIEIANTKNLSRASERLGISQPSLTIAVKRIEASMGTSIFHRHKGGVELTQAGKQLLAHSKSLLETWENLRSKALTSQSEVQGSYSIGCHPSVGLYTLGHFLPNLFHKYPNLDVSLKHDLSRKIYEGVVSSQIDMGIVVNPMNHPDLIIHPLCEDKVSLWCSSMKTDSSTFASGKSVLLCDPDLIQIQSIMKELKKKNIRPSRVLTSNNLEVISNLTERGCGIGIVPGRVAARWDLKLCTEFKDPPTFDDEIALIYRVENKRQKTVQVIAQEIRKVFAT